MRDVFISTLLTAALKDPKIVLITGDLGFKVFDEFREKVPSQFINAGVAEQNMTSLAVGMALEGFTVFTYSIANFSTLRCLEQIRNDACYHNANVKVVSVGAGFSYGALGISHHATEDISIMRSLPDITLCSPGCDWEVSSCTDSIINTPGTAYLRLDRSSAGNTRINNEEFILGKCRLIKPGHDVTIVATGGILLEAIKASDALQNSSISARVISVPTIKPFDPELIENAVKETSGLIVVEEHTVDGGLSGLIAENLMESGKIPGFFKRIGLKSEFSSVVGSQEYLRERYGITSEQIIKVAKHQLSNKQLNVSNTQRAANL